MASKEEYPVLVGQIQQFGTKDFITDREVEVDGEDVTVHEVTIKVAGTQGGLVKITLWPQFAGLVDDLEAGDTLIVGGKFSVSKGKTATFFQQSAQSVTHLKSYKAEASSKKRKKAKKEEDFESYEDGEEDPPF